MDVNGRAVTQRTRLARQDAQRHVEMAGGAVELRRQDPVTPVDTRAGQAGTGQIEGAALTGSATSHGSLPARRPRTRASNPQGDTTR